MCCQVLRQGDEVLLEDCGGGLKGCPIALLVYIGFALKK